MSASPALDAEGAEQTLLDPSTITRLTRSDLVVECHDFIIPGITTLLSSWLSATHTVEVVHEGGRDTAAYPLLAPLGSFDRALLVCEFRPQMMHWLMGWGS